jgi:hypothetical protein
MESVRICRTYSDEYKMLEINPILFEIKDLQERAGALRGYL